MRPKSPVECVVGGKNALITGRFPRILSLRSEFYVPLEDPEAFIQSARRSPINADVLTFVQDIHDRSPKYAFHHEAECMAVLSITTYDEWYKDKLYNKPRNMLRKAVKSGIEIRVEAFSEPLLQGIKAIYDETPVRQGRRNRHYGKDLDTLRMEHSTFLDRSQFITASYAGEIVGFAKLTISQECGIFMNFLSKVRHRDKAVNNAIVAKAVELCADRKLGYLVYGVWGSGGTRGLDEFKVANGFERVEVPRYFVPLSLLGRFALRTGIHRGLVHALPRWSIETAARLRKKWNALRFRRLRAD